MTPYEELPRADRELVAAAVKDSGVIAGALPPRKTDLARHVAMHFRGSVPAYVRHLLATGRAVVYGDGWIVTIAHGRCFAEFPGKGVTVRVDERTMVILAKEYLDAKETTTTEPEQLRLFG